jgi:ribosomal protein L23
MADKVEKKEAKPVKKEEKPVAKPKEKKVAIKPEQALKAFDIVLFPLITEKAVNAIEAENKITFVVNKASTRTEVRQAIEKLYEVKVDYVNTIKDMKGRKKAIVQINKAFKASDLAMKLGVI